MISGAARPGGWVVAVTSSPVMSLPWVAVVTPAAVSPEAMARIRSAASSGAVAGVGVHAAQDTVRYIALYSIACILAGQRCLTVLVMAARPRFNPDSLVPLYVQAADYVQAQIAGGSLPVGGRLPSERDLAEEWGIAYQTVRRAMRELRERGLVASVVGKGTFVIARP